MGWSCSLRLGEREGERGREREGERGREREGEREREMRQITMYTIIFKIATTN